MTDPVERARLLAAFEEVLRRNRGRIAVPLSELPGSRDDVRRALLAAAEARGGKLPKSRGESYKAGLVELEAFVSDPAAKLVNDYQDAKSRGERWPPEERERAERVIRMIHARQASLIARLIRPDDLQRMPTRMALEESPVVIGGVRTSLDAVDDAQELQAAAWLMTFLDLAAVIAALAIHRAYEEEPGVWLVLLYTLPILFVGAPLWMALVVPRFLRLLFWLQPFGASGRRVARTLGLCVGIVTPAAVIVLPTLLLFANAPLAAPGSSRVPASVLAGRCTFKLTATVTRGVAAGRTTGGRMTVTVARSGALSGVLDEQNGTRATASGMLIEPGVLGLTLDLGRNRIVAGRLKPYAGCAETTATGTFIAPAVSSSTRADRGNWRITRTG